LYGWLLPLLIGVGVGLFWVLNKEKEEEGDNWMKWGLKVSLRINIAAIVMKYIGYVVYVNVSGY